MATLFPGAIWRPIPVSSSRPKRGKGRAVIFHVAVSESTSLFPLFSTSGNDSHLYVRKDGTAEQYIDLDLVAYASLAANANTISVETQGGVTNADAEPWTAAQLATLARIARWAHDTEGVPLSLMPNSLPTSKGIGYHRLGIDPWRVAGGEVWSSSRGKLCPGAAKIAQVPQIIQLAQEDDMPLTDADAAVVWNHILGKIAYGDIEIGPGNAGAFLQRAALEAARGTEQLTGPQAADNHTLNSDLRNTLAAIVTALNGVQTPAVDAAALADGLAANQDFIDKLADALVKRPSA